MNRSGEAVALALAAHPSLDPARDLMLVYDDLDLPLGRLRLRPRGGAGGHRGVASVIEALATRDLPRLRFGIGRPEAPGEEARNEVVDFVLDAFSEPEEQLLAERIPLAAEAAVTLLRDGAVAAMDRFNANGPTGSDSSGSPGGPDSSDSSGRP
jgi:PTH1 family peptidyl-tRNA hydrolase